MQTDTPITDQADSEFANQTVSKTLVNLLPFFGLIIGILMWLIDAAIDVLFIHQDVKFWAAVFTDESTEIWMRTLIVIVITISAVFFQYFLRKQYKFEALLLKYQHHLEYLVEQRTKELEHLANFDVLTGIYNRRKVTDILENETERAKRYHLPLSLILFDVDYFKSVNDQYGHSEGDRVLKDIGTILRHSLRQSDIFARWGGEEFVITMPHTDLATAKTVAENLQQAVRTITYGDDSQSITASFGVAQLDIEENSQMLLNRADDALYEAKNNGRDTIAITE